MCCVKVSNRWPPPSPSSVMNANASGKCLRKGRKRDRTNEQNAAFQVSVFLRYFTLCICVCHSHGGLGLTQVSFHPASELWPSFACMFVLHLFLSDSIICLLCFLLLLVFPSFFRLLLVAICFVQVLVIVLVVLEVVVVINVLSLGELILPEVHLPCLMGFSRYSI